MTAAFISDKIIRGFIFLEKFAGIEFRKEGSVIFVKRKYPVIDIKRTGQKIKHIMQMRGMTVKDVQEFLELSTPQSIYHWFDGRNLPTMDNLYALSELFRIQWYVPGYSRFVHAIQGVMFSLTRQAALLTGTDIICMPISMLERSKE